MGASESSQHDQANAQQSNEKPSTLTLKNSEEGHTSPIPNAIPQKRTELGSEVKPPPHNFEAIVKDAAIDKSSTEKLYQQLYTGVLLNQKKQKYWVDKKSHANCFMLYARSLSVTWSEDRRFWHWPYDSESDGVFVDVAELLNVCWLEVHGKLEASMLSPGVLYEFVFVVMLKDPAYGWEVPVNLRLTLPDGTKQEHKENLMEKPRGRWIEIVIGEFMALQDKPGEIECSLFEFEGGKWKKGLLIKGVAIRPKTSIKITKEHIQAFEEMAQAFSHDGIRSLWSQCEESKKLHFISHDKPCLVGQLNAKDLSISSGSDLCHWKWSHVRDGISGDMNEVAELLEIRWLQVDGRYEAKKLKEGLLYEVQYVVMLKDNHTITTPLKLVLTLPDGTKHESSKNLMEEPRNHMIGLKLGHFLTQNLGGDVKFSLLENSSAQKRGLVVIGALIVPNIV